jgi:hypothetical protein
MITRTEVEAVHGEPRPTAAIGARRALEPRWHARAAAHLRSGSLDRELMSGADPARSPALAARACLLTSRRYRAQMAEGLERLVSRAQRPQRRWWDLTHREAVLANSSDLHALAMTLRGDRPVYAAGMARLTQFLADGTGPVHNGGANALARALSDARAALGGAS